MGSAPHLVWHLVWRFGAACDYTPLDRLAETHQMFAEFDAVEL